jgi:sirohydrochlorin ferrochelatase
VRPRPGPRELSDPPLLAIAHGSRDPRSAAMIDALTRAVRRAKPGLRVAAGYLDHCAPSVGQVLDRFAAAGAREVVALPLLLTAAYHSGVDVPHVLHQAGRRHPQLTVLRGATLGPDPLLRAAVDRTVADLGLTPGPDAGLALASAGSSDPAARAVIQRVATDLADAGWAAVLPCYASASAPDTASALAELRRRGLSSIAVASYFLAPGFLPDRVRAAAGRHPVGAPLGGTPELVSLVLRRYDEARAASHARSA